MRANTERLVNEFSTVATRLGGEARVHSDDLMTSSLSLIFKDVEKRAPTGVQDALGQMMVLDQVGDRQVLDHQMMIAISILFCRLEMEITALAAYLQVRLGNVLGGFAPPIAAFCATAQDALFASQGALGAAIKAGIVNRLPFTICEEEFQANIDPDIRMGADRRAVFRLRRGFAHDQSVPMSIGTQDQENSLGRSLDRAMHLDFQRVPEFLGDNQVFLILMQIAIFAILSKLNRVPLVRTLKARETHFTAQCFPSKKTFEGFTEAISKGLYSCGWHMVTATPCETSGHIILAGESAFVLILLFDRLKHLVIEPARLAQTLHEQMVLCCLHVKAILKRFHGLYSIKFIRNCQEHGHSSPGVNAGGSLAAFGRDCGEPKRSIFYFRKER